VEGIGQPGAVRTEQAHSAATRCRVLPRRLSRSESGAVMIRSLI
jgi:hypothetical protein